MLNRVLRVAALIVLLSPAVFAAEDFTGKWGGSFVITMDGNPPKDDVAHMVVTKHTATEFTGTIGPTAEEQWPFAKSKVVTVKENGKDVIKITFEVQADGGGGPVLAFALAHDNGHLKGTAKAEQDGRTMSAVIDLTRIK